MKRRKQNRGQRLQSDALSIISRPVPKGKRRVILPNKRAIMRKKT